MKYIFGGKKKKQIEKKIMQQKLKIQKKTKNWNTILSYLTQHKTQRNLGGVIFCRHMWKFRDAYIDFKKKVYMSR